MMTTFEGMKARARSFLFPRAAHERMEEEFAFHIEMETQKGIDAGLDPREARRRALLTFGGTDRYGEGMRDGRGLRALTDFVYDVRYSLRTLMRAPVFAAVSILTIAIGAGASTGLFSVANTLILQELPVPDASHVVAVQEKRDGNTRSGIEGSMIPFARYEAYRDRTQSSFEQLAAVQNRPFSVNIDGAAVAVPGALVTRNYFAMLGILPQTGSWYRANGAHDVVISDRLWRTRFGASHSLIGNTLMIDGRPFTVAGVAPANFDGTTTPFVQDLWLPYDAFNFMSDASSADRWVGMIGRVHAGTSLQRVQTVVQATALAVPPEASDTKVYGARAEVVTGLNGNIRKPLAGALAAIIVLAVLVLMIASANIAGMLLARASARTREIAVRISIGAGRMRIVRQMLTETLVLFLLGGAGGLFIAYAIARGVSSISLPIRLPVILHVAVDLKVMAFAFGTATVTGIIFGLAPALNASRTELVSGLKEGIAGGGRRGRGGTKLRSAFVTGQITVAVILMMVGATFVRSLQKANQAELGFDPAGVVAATIDVGARGYTQDKGVAYYDRLLAALRANPDVREVAMSDRMIMGGSRSSGDVKNGNGDNAARTNVNFDRVDTAYMHTLGMQLVQGRMFSGGDVEGTPEVVIINETLAHTFWPRDAAIGRQIWYGKTPYTVVGVVKNAKYNFITDHENGVVILPIAQNYRAERVVYIKSTLPPAQALKLLSKTMFAIDPSIAMQSPLPLNASVRLGLFPLRFVTMLLGIFGTVGLILAILGVYGVLSYNVSQRMREFGVRVALGATARDIRRIVLSRGTMLAVGGATLGMAGGIAAVRLMRGIVPGVQNWDATSIAGVPLVLLATALLASYLPARRAMKVNASVALRADS